MRLVKEKKSLAVMKENKDFFIMGYGSITESLFLIFNSACHYLFINCF